MVSSTETKTGRSFTDVVVEEVLWSDYVSRSLDVIARSGHGTLQWCGLPPPPHGGTGPSFNNYVIMLQIFKGGSQSGSDVTHSPTSPMSGLRRWISSNLIIPYC